MDKGTIQLILDKQAEFQKRFGYSEDISVPDRVKLIHDHSMFLMEETYEMLRELPFHKPWRDYSDLTEKQLEEMLEKAKKEWIDQLHFMMNVGLFLGFDEETIRKKYIEKNGINIERQENPELGYVKDKAV